MSCDRCGKEGVTLLRPTPNGIEDICPHCVLAEATETDPDPDEVGDALPWLLAQALDERDAESATEAQ